MEQSCFWGVLSSGAILPCGQSFIWGVLSCGAILPLGRPAVWGNPAFEATSLVGQSWYFWRIPRSRRCWWKKVGKSYWDDNTEIAGRLYMCTITYKDNACICNAAVWFCGWYNIGLVLIHTLKLWTSVWCPWGNARSATSVIVIIPWWPLCTVKPLYNKSHRPRNPLVMYNNRYEVL